MNTFTDDTTEESERLWPCFQRLALAVLVTGAKDRDRGFALSPRFEMWCQAGIGQYTPSMRGDWLNAFASGCRRD